MIRRPLAILVALFALVTACSSCASGDYAGPPPHPMATYTVRTTYLMPPTTGSGPAALQGRITSVDGQSVLGIMVSVMRTNGDDIATMHAAPDGAYEFSGLAAGECLLAVLGGSTRYVSQWYGGAPLQPGADVSQAPRLVLETGLNQADFQLQVGRIISGLVAWEGVQPDVWMAAFNEDGAEVNGAGMTVDQRYAVIGLAPGVYTIKALRDANTENPVVVAELVVDATDTDVLDADFDLGKGAGE